VKGWLGGSWVVLWLAMGCSSENPGVSLGVQLMHTPSDGVAQSGPERTVTRPNGDVVRLTGGWVNVESVEIFACPATAWKRLLDALSPVTTAHAHTAGTPTKIGTPHVDDLLRSDVQALTLGTLKPPADRYCRAAVTLGPADGDAEGLPTAVPMSGRTLWLEGTVTPAAGGTAQAFQLTSAAEADTDVQFTGAGGAAAPVVLTTAGVSRTGRVVLRYDRWFGAVDPLENGAADALVSAIAESVELQQE